MKASLAIQVLPDTMDVDEILRIVDRVIEMIKDTGLSYVVGPFETTVEAESVDELLDIIKNTQAIIDEEGIGAACYMKLFNGGGADILTIDEKVNKH